MNIKADRTFLVPQMERLLEILNVDDVFLYARISDHDDFHYTEVEEVDIKMNKGLVQEFLNKTWEILMEGCESAREYHYNWEKFLASYKHFRSVNFDDTTYAMELLKE